MATYLYRIGRWAFTNRFKVIGIWLLILVGMGVAASTLAGPTSSSFSIPGIPSEKAQDALVEKFPEKPKFSEDINLKYVIKAPAGKTLLDYQPAINTMVASMKSFDGVKSPDTIINPFVPEAFGTPNAPGEVTQAAIDFQQKTFGKSAQEARTDAAASSPINPDATVAQLGASYNVTEADKVTQKAHDQQTAVADAARQAGLTVEMSGTALPQPAIGATSELIGVGVAIVVLIITFGSFIAWGMPILTALIGLGIGLLAVTAASGFFTLSAETPILATMIGLAVGIDYALFIVSRYRHELLTAKSRADAAGRAVGTAGSAVVFAGLTVIIALSALSIVNIPFLTAMGLAAAVTVLVAVLVALTLLPAVLGLFGSKAFGASISFLNAPDSPKSAKATTPRVSNGTRFVKQIVARPAIALVLAIVVLGVIAAPMVGLKLALPNDGTGDPSTTQRKAYDLVAEGFGAGQNGPLVVVLDGTNVAAADRTSTFNKVVNDIKRLPDVKNALISSADINKAGDTAVVSVLPNSGPSSSETQQLVKDLRSAEGGITDEYKVTYGVTGQTAIESDVSDRLSQSLIPYLAIVVGLAFILLMLVFRSVLVPLTAALGFLLSIVATFGATVAIFQNGDLGLMGNPQPIVSFLPIFLIGIVFGLAMDYQVFLVTRMREEYVHGASARDAIVKGFSHSARVVAAAAAIMISVFAAFMLQDNSLIKSMGFALAAAVFFDAFVIRMIVIPAALAVLGDKAWWLPKWLDRILPNVDVEGEKLGEYLAEKDKRDDRDREAVSV
ncbi:MMPL family transporter [Williamsia maris]|uniref:Drug exporter of the RND superfamily n=1 Tax=Williamsia maris TaxID=72806 RepID=A0ABT1HBW2_9NOCA|nr:MMPL family transporter [Williamsia maris]MCP2175733.1 putative drug exporter of the RND superfamily [Williamsia maris]